MAHETSEGEPTFGRVSRVRGVLFENLTRAASLVGVFVLAVLLVYVSVDAFQPATADPAWYLLLFGTFVVPTIVAGIYCWRRRVMGVGFRAVGAALAGLLVAAVLVLWLGGQLALFVLVAVVLPTVAAFALLARRRRRATTVGLQLAGIAFAGIGFASLGAMFVGTQATLVAAVAVGLPAAALARFFITRPRAGRGAVLATGAGTAGAILAVAGVLAGATLGVVDPGPWMVGAVAGGAALGAAIYGGRVALARDSGTLGLFAPYVLLAGGLAGYLFHREFVVTAPTTPLLYAVVAGLPALAFAVRVSRSRNQGRLGLVLPLVPVVGLAGGLAFHARYVILGPTAVAAFGLAVVASLGAYVWYVLAHDRQSAPGLVLPLVAGGGLAGGIALAEAFSVAGPETWLDGQFLLSSPHYEPALAGIHPALIGSLYLMFVVVFVTFPLGVGAAIYLEEYAPNSRWTRFLEINIANLAGVPSVVYGLLGVGVFIRFGGLSLGAVLAGGLTLSLLILPIVIVSAQEALRSVPDSLRQASLGMGATRWQTVRKVVLPRAIPGILTGTILALGRAVGETAPLLMVGFAAFAGVPDSLTDQGTALPLLVFQWARSSIELFREPVTAAGAVTLLAVLLGMNAVAIVIRNKYQREQ